VLSKEDAKIIVDAVTRIDGYLADFQVRFACFLPFYT
jgi:hypothetical protein